MHAREHMQRPLLSVSTAVIALFARRTYRWEYHEWSGIKLPCRHNTKDRSQARFVIVQLRASMANEQPYRASPMRQRDAGTYKLPQNSNRRVQSNAEALMQHHAATKRFHSQADVDVVGVRSTA